MDVHEERQHLYSTVNVFPGSVSAQLRCGGKLFTFESWHILGYLYQKWQIL